MRKNRGFRHKRRRIHFRFKQSPQLSPNSRTLYSYLLETFTTSPTKSLPIIMPASQRPSPTASETMHPYYCPRTPSSSPSTSNRSSPLPRAYTPDRSHYKFTADKLGTYFTSNRILQQFTNMIDISSLKNNLSTFTHT